MTFMPQRIEFTKQELEVINSMAAIASAAPWGEGDYADWGEKTGKPYHSLRRKVWALLERSAAQREPTRFLFVGERRSPKAITMKVRWKDGRLGAKSLFDALADCGIEVQQCKFVNWFELSRGSVTANWHRCRGYQIVALGKKVEAALIAANIPHVAMIHPAARGAIRKKARYADHVRSVLISGVKGLDTDQSTSNLTSS